MNETLKLIEQLNALKAQSENILKESNEKVSALQNILMEEKDKIADTNIKRFSELINTADIKGFETSITFSYDGSYGKNNYNLFFAKKTSFEINYRKTECENVFYAPFLSGHSKSEPIFSLDGKVDTQWCIKNPKHYIFVDNYEKLEKDIISAIQKIIANNVKKAEKATEIADDTSAKINSLNS